MCQGVSEGTIGGDESVLAEAGVRGADDSVCGYLVDLEKERRWR